MSDQPTRRERRKHGTLALTFSQCGRELKRQTRFFFSTWGDKEPCSLTTIEYSHLPIRALPFRSPLAPYAREGHLPVAQLCDRALEEEGRAAHLVATDLLDGGTVRDGTDLSDELSPLLLVGHHVAEEALQVRLAQIQRHERAHLSRAAWHTRLASWVRLACGGEALSVGC